MNKREREQLRAQLDVAQRAIREARQLVRVATDQIEVPKDDGDDQE